MVLKRKGNPYWSLHFRFRVNIAIDVFLILTIMHIPIFLRLIKSVNLMVFSLNLRVID